MMNEPRCGLLVECLPLFDGIELIRGLCLGLVAPVLLSHLVCFAVLIVVGRLSPRADRAPLLPR